jgi:hypothetical protein
MPVERLLSMRAVWEEWDAMSKRPGTVLVLTAWQQLEMIRATEMFPPSSDY